MKFLFEITIYLIQRIVKFLSRVDAGQRKFNAKELEPQVDKIN